MAQSSSSSSFTTFNQFDKRFNDFGKFSKDRTICPLFGLLTCYNFMQTGETSQKQHENNVYAAVTNYSTNEYPKYMLFEELLLLANGTLNQADINATSPEMLTQNIVGYEHMFKFGYEQNYCVLLLKNRNYIAILYKHTPEGGMFSVRDCHENTQRNFSTFEELRIFLNNVYQFEQQTIVGGVRIAEFENVEFLTIDLPFELVNIDTGLIDDTIEEEKTYVEEKIEFNKSEHTSNVTFTKEDEYAFSLQLDGDGDDYVDFV